MMGTRGSRTQLAAHVDAGDLGQHDIEEYERGAGRVETLDRFRSVGRGLDQEPLSLQRDRESIPVGLLVVDHENQGRIGHRSSVGFMFVSGVIVVSVDVVS